jgi:adenosylcobinamide kinase/adenosylcobinamide-phosphate guanylyltransferase
MGHIIFVTGGCRSGKSSHALSLTNSILGSKTFIATCVPHDEEMKDRVKRHQAERLGQDWETMEEPIELANVIDNSSSSIILVDCLTLWTSNLMFDSESKNVELEESGMSEKVNIVIKACERSDATIIFVGNEVGLGIVPDNALARRFRDLNGRCNQMIAQASDDAVMMVSGCPLMLKSSPLRNET